MPRNRMIKPEFWNDEKLAKEKRDIRLMYIGLWTISDDHGTVRSNPVFIKNSVFPYDEDLRVGEVKLWLGRLVNARMLEPFDYNGEGFYNIRTFNSHQKVDKPSRPIVPIDEKKKCLELIKTPEASESLDENSRDTRETLDPKLREEKRSKENGANALTDAKASADEGRGKMKKVYKGLLETVSGKEKKEVWPALKNFIAENKPEFIEPYVDTWNLFATIYKLSEIESVSDSRKKKFATRLSDSGFDFLRVLEKIKTSPHLKGDNQRGWKVTFDWIIENDKNYLKIIEGQYE